MNGMMRSFFGIKDVTPCWEYLAKQWQVELDSAVENDVVPYLERVNKFHNLIDQLNDFFIKLFVDRKENCIQFDKEKLVAAQSFLKRSDSNLEQAVDRIVEKNFINFENLFQVFAEILPSIMHKIEIFKFRNDETLQFEYDEIEVLDTKATKVQNEINNVETSLEPFLKKDEEKFKKFCMSNPATSSTLMCTPALNRQINHNRIKNRLPMLNSDLSQINAFKKPIKISGAINMSRISDGRLLLAQSSQNRLRSLDSSLAILSKKKRTNILGVTSTPKPSMNCTVNCTRAKFSNLVGNPVATTPDNAVDRFHQSNLQAIMRSPSRHLATDHNMSTTDDDDVFT